MTRPYIPFRAADARDLAVDFTALGLPVPTSLARVVEIATFTQARIAAPFDRPCLDMTEAELLDYALDRSRRRAEGVGTPPYLAALEHIADQAADEAAARLRAGEIDEVIDALRAVFDPAARVLEHAASLGFTHATTAQQVIDRNDRDAVATWQKLPDTRATMATVARIRERISERLNASPSYDDLGWDAVGSIDYSVCYAAGDGFSTDGGLYVHGQLDWLALARGGLRLNTPSECHAKLARARGLASRRVPLDQAMPAR